MPSRKMRFKHAANYRGTRTFATMNAASASVAAAAAKRKAAAKQKADVTTEVTADVTVDVVAADVSENSAPLALENRQPNSSQMTSETGQLDEHVALFANTSLSCKEINAALSSLDKLLTELSLKAGCDAKPDEEKDTTPNEDTSDTAATKSTANDAAAKDVLAAEVAAEEVAAENDATANADAEEEAAAAATTCRNQQTSPVAIKDERRRPYYRHSHFTKYNQHFRSNHNNGQHINNKSPRYSNGWRNVGTLPNGRAYAAPSPLQLPFRPASAMPPIHMPNVHYMPPMPRGNLDPQAGCVPPLAYVLNGHPMNNLPFCPPQLPSASPLPIPHLAQMFMPHRAPFPMPPTWNGNFLSYAMQAAPERFSAPPYSVLAQMQPLAQQFPANSGAYNVSPQAEVTPRCEQNTSPRQSPPMTPYSEPFATPAAFAEPLFGMPNGVAVPNGTTPTEPAACNVPVMDGPPPLQSPHMQPHALNLPQPLQMPQMPPYMQPHLTHMPQYGQQLQQPTPQLQQLSTGVTLPSPRMQAHAPHMPQYPVLLQEHNAQTQQTSPHMPQYQQQVQQLSPRMRPLSPQPQQTASRMPQSPTAPLNSPRMQQRSPRLQQQAVPMLQYPLYFQQYMQQLTQPKASPLIQPSAPQRQQKSQQRVQQQQQQKFKYSLQPQQQQQLQQQQLQQLHNSQLFLLPSGPLHYEHLPKTEQFLQLQQQYQQLQPQQQMTTEAIAAQTQQPQKDEPIYLRPASMPNRPYTFDEFAYLTAGAGTKPDYPVDQHPHPDAYDLGFPDMPPMADLQFMNAPTAPNVPTTQTPAADAAGQVPAATHTVRAEHSEKSEHEEAAKWWSDVDKDYENFCSADMEKLGTAYQLYEQKPDNNYPFFNTRANIWSADQGEDLFWPLHPEPATPTKPAYGITDMLRLTQQLAKETITGHANAAAAMWHARMVDDEIFWTPDEDDPYSGNPTTSATPHKTVNAASCSSNPLLAGRPIDMMLPQSLLCEVDGDTVCEAAQNTPAAGAGEAMGAEATNITDELRWADAFLQRRRKQSPNFAADSNATECYANGQIAPTMHAANAATNGTDVPQLPTHLNAIHSRCCSFVL